MLLVINASPSSADDEDSEYSSWLDVLFGGGWRGRFASGCGACCLWMVEECRRRVDDLRIWRGCGGPEFDTRRPDVMISLSMELILLLDGRLEISTHDSTQLSLAASPITDRQEEGKLTIIPQSLARIRMCVLPAPGCRHPRPHLILCILRRICTAEAAVSCRRHRVRRACPSEVSCTVRPSRRSWDASSWCLSRLCNGDFHVYVIHLITTCEKVSIVMLMMRRLDHRSLCLSRCASS